MTECFLLSGDQLEGMALHIVNLCHLVSIIIRILYYFQSALDHKAVRVDTSTVQVIIM